MRATKSHGGMPFADLASEDLDALRRGADNLAAHVTIVKQYGLPCVVTINSFPTDTAEEMALVKELAIEAGAETVVVHNGFAQGRRGRRRPGQRGGRGVREAEHLQAADARRHAVVEQIEAIAQAGLRRRGHRVLAAGR